MQSSVPRLSALCPASLRTSYLAACSAAAICGCIAPQEPQADLNRQPAMNTAQLCAMHELMMAGTTPEEQRTMIEQHLRATHGTVDPEMVARHRRTMTRECAAGAQPAR